MHLKGLGLGRCIPLFVAGVRFHIWVQPPAVHALRRRVWVVMSTVSHPEHSTVVAENSSGPCAGDRALNRSQSCGVLHSTVSGAAPVCTQRRLGSPRHAPAAPPSWHAGSFGTASIAVSFLLLASHALAGKYKTAGDCSRATQRRGAWAAEGAPASRPQRTRSALGSGTSPATLSARAPVPPAADPLRRRRQGVVEDSTDLTQRVATGAITPHPQRGWVHQRQFDTVDLSIDASTNSFPR